MKSKITEIIVGCILILAFGIIGISCTKSEDDKTAENLLLLSFLSRGGNSEQVRTASSVRTAVSGVNGAIRSASQQAFLFKPGTQFQTKDELIARLQQKVIREKILKDLEPKSFPTALEPESGSCTGNTCNAVLNGTVNCPTGGKATLEKLEISMTYAGAGFKGTNKGKIKLDKCASYGADYFNFPSYVGSVASGDITLDSNSDFTFTSNSQSTQTTQIVDIKLVENATINSSNLKIGEATETSLTDVKTNIDLQINSTLTNLKTNVTSQVFSFEGNYSDILTGSATLTGSIGGVATNQSKTYSGETFKYYVKCEFTSSSGQFENANCTVTNL